MFKKNKKEEDGCFVCGSSDHCATKCPNRKGRKPQPEQKTTNMVTSTGDGTSGYGNISLILSVFQSTTWWLDSGANVHVCSDASLFFSSNQVTRDSSVMMGNGSHASVYCVGMIGLMLTLEKIMQLKNVQQVPSINKSLVSGSLLCRCGFKIVLELNKFIMSKCGQFIGKCYMCGCLFHLSVSDFVISL
jgi:hypothetical protein